MLYDILLHLKGIPQTECLSLRTYTGASQALLWAFLTEPHVSHGSGRLGQEAREVLLMSPTIFLCVTVVLN